MKFRDNFTKNTKYLRKKNKYTQKFVADHLGLSRESYQYFESSSVFAFLVLLERLCSLYNITPNDIFLKDLASGETAGKFMMNANDLSQHITELKELELRIVCLEDRFEKLRDSH